MDKINLYFAGPLFSIGERESNKRIIKGLRERISNITIMIPQVQAKRINTTQRDFIGKTFEYCIRSIDRSDVLLCILDGPDVDSGTCIEMGYAYARNKPILGVRTDPRGSEQKGVNLMVANICRELIWLPDTRLSYKNLLDQIIANLKHIFKDKLLNSV